MKLFKHLFLPFVACLLTGCAHTITYNPTYIRNDGISTVPRFSGKLLIYNTSQENKSIFKGGPKSLTGVAWQLHVPLGGYTKGAAGEVYGHLFNQGYENAEKINSEKADQFSAIVHPVVENFAWRMNQAQNVGFAITPQVKMTLHFQLLSGENTILFEREYESGWTDGRSYMINFSPFESVNQAVHKTLADLMKLAALDMDGVLRNNSFTGSRPPFNNPDSERRNTVAASGEPRSSVLSLSTLKMVSYQYDAQTQKGSLSVDISGHGIEAREWVVKNIGKICSSKEVLLEAGQESTSGGRYRVLNESLKDGILTIDFTAGFGDH